MNEMGRVRRGARALSAGDGGRAHLDDGGHEQPADGLERDDRPDERVEADEEAVRRDRRLGRRREQQRRALWYAEEAELHIAHPDRDGGALDALLEVDVGEAREQARQQHRGDPEQLRRRRRARVCSRAREREE